MQASFGFPRRYRSAAADPAAAGLLLTAVSLAVAGLLIWNEQHKTQHALDAAVAAQQRADAQAAIAQAVNDFLQHDLLELADPAFQIGGGLPPDPDVKLRTLLDRAATRMDARFRDQPLILNEGGKNRGESTYCGKMGRMRGIVGRARFL